MGQADPQGGPPITAIDTGHVRLTLRPYQVEMLERIAAAEARGVHRQLAVAATGLGKTVCFVALAQQRGKRTLILAHRDELIGQAVAKVLEWWPDAPVGVVKAERNEVRAQVVVASVQTLARPRRLAQLVDAYANPSVLVKAPDPFDLLVTDEAHHSSADSYVAIYDALGVGTPDGPLHVGVTATPDRGDGKGLDGQFDEVVACYDILWGIRAGYLADLRGRRVTIEHLDLSGVKVRRGDYEAGAAGEAMEAAGAPEGIARAWLAHAKGRRTLVFTPTVETARLTAEAFTNRGVAAGFVHGGTPLDERRQVLADYAAGRLDVLCNCAVLTEGYDDPRTDCIVVARPTRSRALYAQMIGRGTRRHPDKADCLVLDVVGASAVHSLVTIPSLFGIEVPAIESGLGDGSTLLTAALDDHDREMVRQGRLAAEDAELFTKLRTAGVAWAATHQPGALSHYVKSLGKGPDGVYLPTVVLAQRSADEWTAGLLLADGTKRVLIAQVGMELAQGVAEDYVRKNAARVLVDTGAPWRKRKPSPKAMAAAKRWRLPNPEQYATAGALSEALDAHIARKKGADKVGVQ